VRIILLKFYKVPVISKCLLLEMTEGREINALAEFLIGPILSTTNSRPFIIIFRRTGMEPENGEYMPGGVLSL